MCKFSDEIQKSRHHPTKTSFAELRRPKHPPKVEENKSRSFGFSLLRNKTLHTPPVDNRCNNINVGRAQSFLSIPVSSQKGPILSLNMNSSVRRSPSPKMYHAPPIPTMAIKTTQNIATIPTETNLSPQRDKTIHTIDENANKIKFKLMSSAGIKLRIL